MPEYTTEVTAITPAESLILETKTLWQSTAVSAISVNLHTVRGCRNPQSADLAPDFVVFFYLSLKTISIY